MKKIYFTLIWSCLAAVLFAQKPFTLKWQMVDEKLNPVSEVAVVKKGISGGVDANKLGEFSIDVVPGRDTMIILCLGYEPLEIPITADTPKKWIEVLANKPYTLDEILIVGHFHQSETVDQVYIQTIRYDCPMSFPKNEFILDSIIPFGLDGSLAIKIFPTPTNNSVFLRQQSALGMVDLYNLNGQKLQSFNFGEQLNASIDLSSLPAGTYFLRSNQGWVEKVVLQK